MKEANINIDPSAADQPNTVDAKQLYRLINEEIARKEYHPAPRAKAIAAAQGDTSQLKNLYIKFRYAELASQFKPQAQVEENNRPDEPKAPNAVEIYRIIHAEIARKEYHPKPKAQALAAAQGDKNQLKDLYIKFRYQELLHETELLQQLEQQKQIEFERKKSQQVEKKTQSAPRIKRFALAKWSWLYGVAGIVTLLWFNADWLIRHNPLHKTLEQNLPTPIVASKVVTRQPQSVAQGKVNPQPNLVAGQENSKAISKEESLVVAQYRKAAEQGTADAQFNLGLRYETGNGIAADKTQAVTWYRKAAEQNVISAQFKLATLYATGQGIAQDDSQALAWFRKAAEQGDVDAQFNVGVMYEQGKGVAQNRAQALVWYRKAAEQGFVNAQFNLGVMYATGLGVPKDEVQAVAWFGKAAAQGDLEAKKALLRFAK